MLIFLNIIFFTIYFVRIESKLSPYTAHSLLGATANPETSKAAPSSAFSSSQRAYIESRLKERYRKDNESYALLKEKFKGRVVHCHIPAFLYVMCIFVEPCTWRRGARRW